MGSSSPAEHEPPARRRARRWARRTAVAALGLVGATAVLAAVAAWQAQSFVEELRAGPKRVLVESARRELDVPPKRPLVEPEETPDARTILVIGHDGRWQAGADRRADTIILVRVDPAAQRISVLPVPRDLRVAIPRHGYDRINWAYRVGGPALLVRTVRETFGVEIDHFVAVDYRGFRRLVTELGGIYLPIDRRYFNRNDGRPETNFADIDLRHGYQRLDGEQALAFVRYRQLDSDLVRAARQQLFLREAARLLREGRFDFLRLRRLVRLFAEATASDIDSVRTLWQLVDAVESTPGERVRRVSLPVADLRLGGADYLASSLAQRREAVRRWLGAGSPPRQATTRRTPAAPARQRAPRLVPDGGRGRQLVARLGPNAPCAPTALPRGFSWPYTDREAARAYRLQGKAAVALSATGAPGQALLWMMTTWNDPPVLDGASSSVRRNGRSYDLYFENRRLRQVAWRNGRWRVWVTNTLRSELSIAQMLALADSCVRR